MLCPRLTACLPKSVAGSRQWDISKYQYGQALHPTRDSVHRQTPRRCRSRRGGQCVASHDDGLSGKREKHRCGGDCLSWRRLLCFGDRSGGDGGVRLPDFEGITCVLLKYRVPNSGVHGTGPGGRRQLSRKLRWRSRMPREQWVWCVFMQRSTVLIHTRSECLDFQAGGHLATDISTHFERRVYPVVDAADKESCRPDFAVVLYPGHLWTDSDMIGLNPDVPVSNRTPPAFLLHAQNDPVDNVNNSLAYYIALKKAKVPAEMHLYAEGKHAFGLRAHEVTYNAMASSVETWLGTIGMIP